MDSFLFISSDVKFQETTPKGALLEVTMLELNKVSQQGTEYRLVEGDRIAASLVGQPIYYGVDWKGKHKKNTEAVGIVESAKKVGKKIKGIVRIWGKDLVDRIKKGIKFLFSVGGVADFAETIKKGGRYIKRLVGAICNSLQIVNANVKVGFPSAKMERVIEIQETVPYNSWFYVTDDYCPIETLINEGIESGIVTGTILSRIV